MQKYYVKMIKQEKRSEFDYYSGAHNPEVVGFFSFRE